MSRPQGYAGPSVDEYDALVYPGFLRRPMARWNEDGSCAPTARVRNGKGDATFVLTLTKAEIESDLAQIQEAEGNKRKKLSPTG